MEIEMRNLIEKLTAALEELASRRIPFNVQYWSIQDIAECTGYSDNQVTRWTALPSFPAARRIGGRSHPRWRATEVIEWIEKHKDRR